MDGIVLGLGRQDPTSSDLFIVIIIKRARPVVDASKQCHCLCMG